MRGGDDRDSSLISFPLAIKKTGVQVTDPHHWPRAAHFLVTFGRLFLATKPECLARLSAQFQLVNRISFWTVRLSSGI